jgi:hypothetical protein
MLDGVTLDQLRTFIAAVDAGAAEGIWHQHGRQRRG